MKKQVKAVQAFADRHSLLLGAVLAALLAGALALYNVSSGPLSNLNDIGGWSNRALFIVMTAAAHAAVLLMQTVLYRKSFIRLAIRQILLTAGLVILLLGINQKTCLFVEQVLPLVRQMDAAALAAESPLNLSTPALTVLYAVTRGPIYDLYMLKLLCIVCFLALAVLAAYAADRHELGWRAEVLLTLCVILPQGFLAAGCAAQIEVLSALLLGISLTLLDEKKHPLAAMLLYGAAGCGQQRGIIRDSAGMLAGRKGQREACAYRCGLCGRAAGVRSGDHRRHACGKGVCEPAECAVCFAGVRGGRAEFRVRVSARGDGGNAGVFHAQAGSHAGFADQCVGVLHAGAFCRAFARHGVWCAGGVYRLVRVALGK